MLSYVWKKGLSIFSKRPKEPETSQSTDIVPDFSQRLADAVKEKSKLIETQTGPLPLYKIPLTEEHFNIDGCNRFTFGRDNCKHNRTILVLGATGAGKSTLINGMINYILGVEWDDSFRFKLVDEGQTSQAISQTSEVTAYKINHREGFKIEHSLTIVDTPGFGDTRGIQRDAEITKQLENLFSDKNGVSEIAAVCFVTQASLARLTTSQKYVFDSVLSIFGRDIADNIRVMVTFADGQRPPVLEAINASGVPCPKAKDGMPAHFKFNNSALFADNKSSASSSQTEEDEDGGFDGMFWKMGVKSMKRFFTALNQIETRSLAMTQEVLRERRQLENSVENLQKRVKHGLAMLENLKEAAEKLKECKAEISRNENYQFEVTITKPVQIDISQTNTFLTNCQQCNFTCHNNCIFANDADKHRCCAMGPDGYCTQCPGVKKDGKIVKCYWNVHFNQKYKWDYQQVKEMQTVKELQEKFFKATDAKVPVQALIELMRDKYKLLQDEVVELMDKSANCLNRLKEIALKPNPLSTPDYIDMLIEGEKSEAKPGWKQRVQALIAMREKAEYMARVEQGETLLQSPPSDFFDPVKRDGGLDPDETHGDQDPDETHGDETHGDQDPYETDGDETHGDQDPYETDGDETDGDQDPYETDGDETHGDQDPYETDGDETHGDQDSDQTDGDQDPHKTDDDSDQIHGDQDPDETYGDQDPDKTPGNQDETDVDPDPDETDVGIKNLS